jgi:hypothetical protein
VAIKNGNNDGTTLFAHNASPFFAAIKLLFENRIRATKNVKKINVKKYFFIDITMNFINPPYKFLNKIYMIKILNYE